MEHPPPATSTSPTDTTTATSTLIPAIPDPTPIDVPRLHQRLRDYAAAYGIPSDAVQQMDELLGTPLAARLLALPAERLTDALVTDAYKPRMHVMYSRYMSGVTADFALIVRRAPPAADPRVLPQQQPAAWRAFLQSAATLSGVVPYGPWEQEALRALFGLELPQALLERLAADGVAPVRWEALPDGQGQVAVASGPLVSASLVETTLMQRYQSLTVAVQAAVLAHGGPAAGWGPCCFDRTERLANGLAKLARTVAAINAMRHECGIALFAGRRCSDPLYLALQNLYCAAHLRGYKGTSSLWVAALVAREWADMGVPERERWGGAGRLVGTHAHEQTSAVQQLLAHYDAEAGRRAGAGGSVAITPLLAHLLFLAANGGGGSEGQGATALADTFTTAAFVAVSRLAAVPDAFRSDVEAAYGWHVPNGSTVFDLIRTWRLDSGDYAAVAELLVAAWEARCAERRAAGLPPLPRPLLMHSNLDSVEHIAQVVALDARIRPAVLAFGTLADGFLPFLPTSTPAAAPAAAATGDLSPSGADEHNPATPSAPAQLLVHAHSRPEAGSGPHIELASVVMKLVQARPPRPLPLLAAHDGTAGAGAAAAAAAEAPPGPNGAAGTSGGAPRPPACAVKLGDEANGGKRQVDPRLPAAEARDTVKAAADMAARSARLGAAAPSAGDVGGVAAPLADAAALSAVLAEAYEAVTRGGILNA